MRAAIIIASLIFGHVHFLYAQDMIKRKRISPTSVTLLSDSLKDIRGALYQIKDSSILVSDTRRFEDYRKGNYNVSEIDFNNIQMIKTISKTRTRNGLLIGTASGFVIGGLIGLLIEGDTYSWIAGSQTAAQNALQNGIVCIPFGAIIGATFGSIQIRIPINGSMDNFNRSMEKLNRYSIKY